MELKVEYLPITELKPYKGNAKIHTDEQIEQICQSIRQFGFNDPIAIWQDGIIIEGHGRLEAAKRLQMETVPVIRLDSLTDEERRAYTLVHNKLTMNTDFDFEILERELALLPDIDMEEFGFEFPDTEEVFDGEIYEAEVPEAVEARCKLGDVWRLGRHRLACIDSTNAEAIKILMDGQKADMVFTDPPYGVAIGDKNADLNEIQRAGRHCENIKNDAISVEDLYEILKKAFINVRENSKDDAAYYVTSPQGGDLGLMMMMMMKDAGLPVRHVLMWNKNAATFSIGRLDYDYKHEPIFYTWTKNHHNYRKGKFRTSVWDVARPMKNDLHPTMKPIELMANAMLDCTKDGDIVLDVFGGSGSTLIASEELGRVCYMAELDPKYCDVIITRWENMTGEKAIRL